MSEKRFTELSKAIAETKAKILIEVGVYRCERSRVMINEALKYNKDISFYGFDLFQYMTNELSSKEVSRSQFPFSSKNAFTVLVNEFPTVNLNIIPGDSKITLADQNIPFDVAFIDGGHSLETTQSDWDNISRMMKPGSIVLIDDYSDIPGVFTKQVVDKIDRSKFSVELSEDFDMSTPQYGSVRLHIAKIKRLNHG